MTHDYCFDITDVVACFRNCVVQIMIICVINSGENVISRRSDHLGIVSATSSLEEDQAFRWVFDECGNQNQVSAFMLDQCVAETGGVCLSKIQKVNFR